MPEDYWLPGFDFNVEEWDAKGQTYETLAICRTLARARAAGASATGTRGLYLMQLPDLAKACFLASRKVLLTEASIWRRCQRLGWRQHDVGLLCAGEAYR